MRVFRTIWLLHRWLGVAAGLVLLLSAATGLLLLVKKDYEWIQPPVMKCADGAVAELQPLPKVYEAVFALGLPQFRSEADIARIDFRPKKRLHKVVSRHDDLEVQVCAITLKTSAPRERRSDWLEQLHDGSWFGDFAHDRVMPVAALILLYLSLSGYVMWLWPKWKKRRRSRVER
ncbi:MAG: PepSY domain-containing protein [Planctomycetota bacterium]